MRYKQSLQLAPGAYLNGSIPPFLSVYFVGMGPLAFNLLQVMKVKIVEITQRNSIILRVGSHVT